MARKKEIEQVFLNKTELQQLSKCAIDPFFFSSFIYVVHPKRGKVKFQLYPYQMSVLYNFLINRFNIILKFRQAGITELIAMYCLWLAMFHPDKKINIISIKDSTAKKVLKKIKYMYKNLPPHLRTKIVNGRANEYGCVTEDTVLVGDKGDFKIGDITPKEKGVIDVSHLGLKVLTHEGTFENILKAVNKGEQKTYEIVNNRGKIIRCAENHVFYTTKGWKLVTEVLEKNLDIICWNTDYLGGIGNPSTTLPAEEVIKETKYPGYYASNLGHIYTKKFLKRRNPGELYKMKLADVGHYRVKLSTSGDKKKLISVHRLVWETFNGPIPEGYVIDHIDCNRKHNWLTNLQCITHSENTKRAYKYNRVLVNNNFRPEISLKKLGKLKAHFTSQPEVEYGGGVEIAKKLKLTTKQVSHYRREKSCSHIYVSKIKLLNVTKEVIVDMEVENAHSYVTKSDFVNHNTVTEMEFSNGSFIASIPTTEEAGRSEGLSLLVIDEAAIIRWASSIWASAFPTLSTGGSAILNSTPFGIGNFYHSEWVNAVAGGKSSVFHPIRLRWDMHPERDQLWYDQMSLALGPRRTAQEIDGDFLTSGNNVFDPVDIKAIEDYLDEYTVIERKFHGQYLRYSDYDPSLNYFIGADVATGRAKDYSAFTCIDQWGEEHSVFKGKVPVDKYAKILGDEGKKFGYALLAPETNDIGLAVTTTLQTEGYPNLYYSRNLLEKKKKKGQKRKKREDRLGIADTPGWLTSSANRSVIVEELEEDVRKDNIICKDPFFCQEAYTFIYDSNNRPVALGKSTKKTSADSALDEDFSYTDDSILGKAIANHIRKGKHHNTVVAPQ